MWHWDCFSTGKSFLFTLNFFGNFSSWSLSLIMSFYSSSTSVLSSLLSWIVFFIYLLICFSTSLVNILNSTSYGIDPIEFCQGSFPIAKNLIIYSCHVTCCITNYLSMQVLVLLSYVVLTSLNALWEKPL